jgi:putative methyltransferase (TIGR04325 family)
MYGTCRTTMRYKDFIPPIFMKAAKAVRMARHRPFPKQTFLSYQEAASQCQGFGYEMADLVEIVFRKTTIYRDNCDLQDNKSVTAAEMMALFALGLAYGDRDQINVIDFGGACGAHFFRLKSLLNNSVPLRWHVVETQAMVSRAKELSNTELQFFDSLSAAAASFDHVDVVFSSGTLQYVSDPSKMLMELIACNGKYLALARLALAHGNYPIVSIQESRLSDNGPGPLPPGFKDGLSRYPVTFAAEKQVESLLTERYRVLLRLPDHSIAAEDNRVSGLGYVAQLKALS